MNKVLLVEDDATFSAIIEGYLKKNGFHVDPMFSINSGKEAIKQSNYDIILLDYRLGDGNGLDIVDYLQEQGLSTPVIIMTGFSDVRTAVKAVRKGVYDYITKPVNPDELLMILKEALNGGAVNNRLKEQIKRTPSLPLNEYVKGTSKGAKKLHEYIELVAPTDMSVLIRGESGTGKEYVAKAIHNRSKRADKPFVSIDCGTLSKELAG